MSRPTCCSYCRKPVRGLHTRDSLPIVGVPTLTACDRTLCRLFRQRNGNAALLRLQQRYHVARRVGLRHNPPAAWRVVWLGWRCLAWGRRESLCGDPPALHLGPLAVSRLR